MISSLGAIPAISIILAILICLTSLWDAWFTEHRIRKYGLGIELNPAIAWLIRQLGMDIGIALGITLPTLFLVGTSLMFNLSGLLWLLLGIKGITARYQYISLKFEPEIDRSLAQQDRSESMASTSKPLGD